MAAPPIAIVAPDAGWPAAFAALKERIVAAVPDALAVHHIGSTAVPGLAAKDVIDIQLTVADLARFDGSGLLLTGFVERAGLADHPPAGRSLDVAELAKRFYRGRDRAVNLHVREQGRFNQRYPLLCRDFLRSHPVAAASYGLIKQRLASLVEGDVEAYYDIKDPLFDILMDGAEEWAARVDWRPPPGD